MRGDTPRGSSLRGTHPHAPPRVGWASEKVRVCLTRKRTRGGTHGCGEEEGGSRVPVGSGRDGVGSALFSGSGRAGAAANLSRGLGAERGSATASIPQAPAGASRGISTLLSRCFIFCLTW